MGWLKEQQHICAHRWGPTCINRLVTLRNHRLVERYPSFPEGSDIIGRLCPLMPGSGDQRPKSQRHQKGFISKTGDLPNVNCHLTHRPTAAVPPGPHCRSGVEREFNQGFSCYKRPSTPVGKPRRQTEAKGHEMGPALCSHESRRLNVVPPQTGRKIGQIGGAGTRLECSVCR